MKGKIKNMNKKDLEQLKEKDIYSLLLFALYKLKEIPEYSTISELSYILDKDNLLTFLTYYGGMTIRIPTLREFKLVLSALLLYEYVHLEGIDFEKAFVKLRKEDWQLKEIRKIYEPLCKILDKYEFTR